MGGRKGFTLIETLVAIAVIAVLVGIAVPVLRRAFETSKDVRDLANLRSTHQQFYQWGSEHEDRFVNLGPPPDGEDLMVIGAGPGNGFVVTGYSVQSRLWPLVLARWGAPGVPSWHCVWEPVPDGPNHLGKACEGGMYVRETSIIYSVTFLTEPARWTSPPCREAYEVRDRYYTFVKWSSVAFPSSKGLMIDECEQHIAVERPIVFVDGSAAALDPAMWVGSSIADCPEDSFSAVTRTPYGYLGRDFTR